MKAKRTCPILFILALLLSSTPTAEHHPIQAAERSAIAEPAAAAVEPLIPLNSTDITGLLSVFSGSSATSVIQSPASDWHIECVDCFRQLDDMTDLTFF